MADLTQTQVCNICCIHYNAGLRCCALGSAIEGGRLVFKRGSVAYIVAPATTQVSRTWYARADAVTTAQAAAACGDWFVPTREELKMAAYYRDFWDSYSTAPTRYWSNTEGCAGAPPPSPPTPPPPPPPDSHSGLAIYLNTGTEPSTGLVKTIPSAVRAFRRILY